jgi:phi13 family phage major tail protein
MPESVKTVRFNVSKLVFAVILEDTVTSFKHRPIKKLGEPMQVQLTYTLATGTVYGGGVKQFNPTKVTGATLQLDINKIPIETRAEIYGNAYENGILSVGKNDKANKIAIGYELEAESDTGIKKEMEWIFKGDPQPFGKTTQQTTDNINFSTDTMTINFVPRGLDGLIKKEADTANSAFTAEAAEAFLSTIPGGTLVENTGGQ